MNSIEKIKLGIQMSCSKNKLTAIKYRYEILFNHELPIDYQELGSIRAEYKNELKQYKLLKKMYEEL